VSTCSLVHMQLCLAAALFTCSFITCSFMKLHAARHVLNADVYQLMFGFHYRF